VLSEPAEIETLRYRVDKLHRDLARVVQRGGGPAPIDRDTVELHEAFVGRAVGLLGADLTDRIDLARDGSVAADDEDVTYQQLEVFVRQLQAALGPSNN
jgi:hypothetical protein